ncbi:MAG: tRNA uridine-5-carboxymethylaminomethyl(34) synthesis GTPase MnmE [Mycoplasmataceae bacterium]|nr:tRNA uridine-5-carboxymethylaminomethyl(34) synthesis GTPase MnmE [Mycoplasmataceae bacterium]
MKTIVALATPPMNGAIHIIRISGSKAFNIVNKITTSKIIKRGYEIQKTNILSDKKIIDSVLINKFVSPKSFTGEDLIEINCHGGYYLANKIIELLLRFGCVLALPGEFTQRAYLNNKLTLHEAESINNLINATSEKAIELANNGLDAKTITKLKQFREKLFKLIGQVEVNIDYPEFDDVPNVSIQQFKKIISELIKKGNQIINVSTKVIPILEGINVTIVGRPNVGKSSLFNAILNEQRAIVSNIPGTTRDVVSARVNIGNITINLSDTAGIRTTKNIIESFGVDKSYQSLQNANLILWVVDGSQALTNEDKTIQKLLTNKKHIIVINKSDLPHIAQINGLKVSTVKNNVTMLINRLIKVLKFKTDINYHQIILQSTRSIGSLKAVVNELNDTLKLINQKQPIDLSLEHLHIALKNINIILGEGKSYNFINEMFRKFCVGK